MAAVNPVEVIQGKFTDAVTDVIEHRGETTVVVDAAKIVDVCSYLKQAQGLEFNFLSDITAVDYYPDEPRFAVNYHLYSMIHNRRIRIKAYVDRSFPNRLSSQSYLPGNELQ